MIRGGVGQGPVAHSHPSSRRGPARPPSRPVQQEEHRQELEALRAQLEAERLHSQELHRRFADETRQIKKMAEQERQLLAEKLRSRWEQQRARELQRLWELSQKQRATEIRQLLREKEAEWRQAQELLQEQRDDAVRQARDLQQELAEELVRHGCSSSSEARSKLQEVHRQLHWRKDSKQTARIVSLQNELELQRRLFQQYILEQAEGRPSASHSEDRAAAWHRLQTRLGAGTTGTCSSKSPGASGAAGGGGQQTTHSSLKAHLQGEGKSCGRAVTDVGVQVAAQQEACPPGSGDSQLLQEKAHLQHALEDLQRQCGVLQEETRLLGKESALELGEEVERLQQKTSMLGLLTKHLKENTRQLKETDLKSGKTAAKTEQVDQQQRGESETEAGTKLRPHRNLDQERSRLQQRYEELKVRLREMTNENARRAEENSQLRGQKERIDEVRSDNAALKGKLVQVTEQRNSAIGEAKRLQTRLQDLGCELKAMRQLAGRRQQQENDLEETRRLLQKKKEEVEHLQRAWAEQRRTHEEDTQASQAQLRELEKQNQHQSQQWELLSQQLEQEKRKESNRVGSGLPQVTSSPTAQAYAEQSHDLCNREDSSDVSEEATKVPASHTSTSTSDAAHNSPGCRLLSDEGPVHGNEEAGAEHVSFILQSSEEESLKLRKFLARYSYDPFEGPNEHPEAELPLTAGEYVYVYGDMDEDGWFVGELTDGTRGFVPSNLVEEVSDDDLVTTVPPELRDLLQDSDDELRSCSRRGRKKRRNRRNK
ncbi:RIMS-binding protein 3C-like [Anser cygnoides]|uniref:RIMS-binding protein 3C-like n=1 Tax=Anser cygnoides TaxID=8845 RepID=UPI0034D193DF